MQNEEVKEQAPPEKHTATPKDVGMEMAHSFIEAALASGNKDQIRFQLEVLKELSLTVLTSFVFNEGMGMRENPPAKKWDNSRAYALEKDFADQLSSNVSKWREAQDKLSFKEFQS